MPKSGKVLRPLERGSGVIQIEGKMWKERGFERGRGGGGGEEGALTELVRVR